MTGDQGTTYKLKLRSFIKVILHSNVFFCLSEPSFGFFIITKYSLFFEVVQYIVLEYTFIYYSSSLSSVHFYSWCHDLAKQLSHYLFFFLFFFSFGLTIHKKHGKVSHHMTKLYEEHGKIVHRPCSSCISSVQEWMRTLSSSSCQLRLGVDLSPLS